jgi:uncharacterized membrane protein YgaE (UPF0421/DUF939 family)
MSPRNQFHITLLVVIWVIVAIALFAIQESIAVQAVFVIALIMSILIGIAMFFDNKK